MAKEADEAGDGRGVVGRMGGRDQKKGDEDYELFLRDLEEDAEMRQAINLYKAGNGPGTKPGQNKAQYGMDVEPTAVPAPQAEEELDTEGDDDDDGDEVGPSLHELLDEMHLEDEEELEAE